MEECIIAGGGTHSKVVISIIKKIKSFDILGFTDIEPKEELLGIKYLGNDSVLEELLEKHKNLTAFLGVGGNKINRMKENLLDKISQLGYSLPPLISPHSIVNEAVEIGDATQVIDGAIINVMTKIGKGCLINTNCSVDHDCVIGDYTHIAPGVAISGSVTIGKRCMIGTGARIVDGVSIPDDTFIGAGAVVHKDIREPGLYVGLPARKVPGRNP